jgi:hypothetical protein
MEVLNPGLYESIKKVFGEIRVSARGQRGAFRIPDMMKTLRKARSRIYADVDDWGEVYHVNCPACGDTRHRLYFSYLCGAFYRKGGGPKLHFSRGIFDCKNEKCREELKPWLQQVDWPSINVLDMEGAEVQVSTANLCLAIEATPPAPLQELLPENMPGFAFDYLVGNRGFDPMELNRDYGCRLVPVGAVWKYPDGYEKRWTEEQLFIPIIQGRRLVSWQTRPLRETSKEESKYFNMPGSSSAVYNLDQAMYHRDIVVVEGVTDTWRAGSHAIALLGSNLTGSQEFTLKTVWGLDGRAVFLVEHDAVDKMTKACRRLLETGAFARGLVMVLLDGKDPAEYTREALKSIQDQASEMTSATELVSVPVGELTDD